MNGEIDNINDRTLLILLEYTRNRNKKEKRLYERLSKIYVNNKSYERFMRGGLVKDGLLECIMPIPKHGKYGIEYTEEPIYLTTEKGRKSIVNGLFPSESKAIRIKIIIKWGTLIAAVITALCAVCTFLLKCI